MSVKFFLRLADRCSNYLARVFTLEPDMWLIATAPLALRPARLQTRIRGRLRR